MRGKAGSVDVSAVRNEMTVLCKKLQKYGSEHIYNQDEPGAP